METDNSQVEGFTGKVVKVNSPKIYHGPVGTYRAFYVKFEDGTNAMFSACHFGQFTNGDEITIKTFKRKENWLHIPESSVITVKERVEQAITGEWELGYVTRLREDALNKWYLSYGPKAINGSPKIETVHIPAETVWRDNRQIPRIPAYSRIKATGTLTLGIFVIKAILSQNPITREESVVLHPKDFTYHTTGADFFYQFGEETFKGTIKPPFFSSQALNIIRKQFKGWVEVHGIWVKRGTMTKDEAGWHEDTYWLFDQGSTTWDPDYVPEIKKTIDSYMLIERFSHVSDIVSHPAMAMTIEEIQKLFANAGFQITAEDAIDMFWRQDHEERFLTFLRARAKKMYVTPRDEFIFITNGNAVILESPSDREKTLVFSPIGIDPNEHVKLIQEQPKLQILSSDELKKKLGYFTSVSHKEAWENDMNVAILEAENIQRQNT